MIPARYAFQIIREATDQSSVLQLANRVPMGTQVERMPVPKTFPKAGWTANTGGRKPYTDLKMDWEEIVAEEVAAIVAIPDAIIDDSTIDLWAYARPLLSEAIATALDDAVLFGLDAPPTFPVGGLAAMAVNVSAGTDHVDTLNSAFSAVENSGLAITGTAADMSVRGILRNARDSDGAMLCGCDWVDGRERTSMFGYPVRYVPFTPTEPDLFTGNWRYVFIGVRQDIRFDFNRNAVVVDQAGNVLINGWQDNVSALKVWARFGFAAVRPVTRRCPEGATIMATASLGGGDAVRCQENPSSPAAVVCARNGCGHPASDHADGTGACEQPPPEHCEEFVAVTPTAARAAAPAPTPRPRRPRASGETRRP
jgi:HK97 family phage major capsid protein